MFSDDDELPVLRPAIQEAKLGFELLQYATSRDRRAPDWLASNGHGPKSLADAIILCRNAFRRGDTVAAELIGIAAELSPTLLGCHNDSIAAAIPDLIGASTER